MKCKKVLLACLLGLIIPLCSCSSRDVNHDAKDYILDLDITSKNEFKILQLTDIHMANKDNREYQYKFLDLIIKDANADMIVVTGDLFTFADKIVAKELFSFLDSYDVPWTVTLGNHDEQCYFSVDWLTNYLNKYESNCLFKDIQNDDVFGNSNFAVTLKKNNKAFEQIILLDSNRYNYGDYIGYDYLKDDQIDWYERVVKYTKEQNNNVTVPSILFCHIPVPEYQDAWDKYKENSNEVEYLYGEMGESASAPKINTGFFDKMVELGSTRCMAVGHDHVNNWIIKYKGIYLTYGITSTDRIYYDEDMIGGRTITIKADHSLEFGNIYHSYSEVA